jgi:hypothetical protein
LPLDFKILYRNLLLVYIEAIRRGRLDEDVVHDADLKIQRYGLEDVVVMPIAINATSLRKPMGRCKEQEKMKTMG